MSKSGIKYPVSSSGGGAVSSVAGKTGAVTLVPGDVIGLQGVLDGKQDDLNGTGLVRMTGTTVSYDNTSYATTASLSSYVPTSRVISINGTPFDLSANRSWTTPQPYQEADYIIEKISGTTYARPRVGSGLSAISNADSYTVIQGAINALTPAGANGSGGGKIFITKGEYTLSDELIISGWEGEVFNPNSQIIIEGVGKGTYFIAVGTGKNGVVVRNGASFVLRNLRIYANSNARSCIRLDSNGATTEMSSRRSIIDNVKCNNQSTTYPAIYMRNMFDLNAPLLTAESENYHAFIIENDSTTTNFGNSNFGFLKTFVSNPGTTYAGLLIRNTGTSKFMNMLTFEHYECISAYYGIYSEGLRFSNFKFVDIEGMSLPVYFSGGATDNTETKSVSIDSGYLFPNSSGTAITTTQATGNNTFRNIYIEGDSSVVAIRDLAEYRGPSIYDVILGGAINTANIVQSDSLNSNIRYRLVNGATVYNKSSATLFGGSISHPISTKTAAYTIGVYDNLILGNTASSSFSITLPTAVGIAGREYTVKKSSASNTLTVNTTSSQTIDGSATYVMTANTDFVTVRSDNANWQVVDAKYPIMTGYTSSAGTVAATDSLVSVINKLNGNDALKAPINSPVFTGNVGMPAVYGQTTSGGFMQILGTSHATKGKIWLNSGIQTQLTTLSATTTITFSHTIVWCDATSGAITMNLPTATSANGVIYIFKKIDSSANAVTIDPNGSETIDGALTYLLREQDDAVLIQSNGTVWRILMKSTRNAQSVSPDGSLWRLNVSDAGVLTPTKIV